MTWWDHAGHCQNWRGHRFGAMRFACVVQDAGRVVTDRFVAIENLVGYGVVFLVSQELVDVPRVALVVIDGYGSMLVLVRDIVGQQPAARIAEANCSLSF